MVIEGIVHTTNGTRMTLITDCEDCAATLQLSKVPLTILLLILHLPWLTGVSGLTLAPLFRERIVFITDF